MIVDDRATNRRILRHFTEKWGMHVQAAASGRQALAWIEQGVRFDVALLDMHMPEMDGLMLTRAIRAYRDAVALPLIMLTSLGDDHVKETVRALGVAAYLTKPIKPAQLHAALVELWSDEQSNTAPAPRPGSVDPEMGRRYPLRILLAEDNVVNQKVALRMLKRLGYRADLASNGLEALEALERQTYDVVLMDVQMPELDGLEATRRIVQRWPVEGRPHIVAMTAGAMQGDREQCLEAGMDNYLSKPVKLADLMQALKAVSPCNRRAA